MHFGNNWFIAVQLSSIQCPEKEMTGMNENIHIHISVVVLVLSDLLFSFQTAK